MTKPLIKPTTTGDIPDLQKVVEAAGLFPGEMLPDMVAPFLSGESAEIWFTAQVDGAPVGLAFTRPEEMADGTWNMLALGVSPDLQGRGIGAALVKATETHLANRGQRILIVDTSGTADFAPARAFYASQGYEEEARIRDYWAAGDDKVTFRKAL